MKKLTIKDALLSTPESGVKKFKTMKEAFEHIKQNLKEIHKDTHVKLIGSGGR